MPDAWRLAIGTFLAMRVQPPRRVDSTVARGAMLLAPVTALPAVVAWTALAALAVRGWVPALMAAALALVTTALLSRAIHLDGLADLADGLASGYSPDRALDVMRRGDTGPAGSAALVLVLLVQGAALASLLVSGPGAALAATSLVASRLAPAVVARRGVPPARREGLGRTVAGCVPTVAWVAVAAAVALAGAVTLAVLGSSWYAAVLVTLAAVLGAWLVTQRAVSRLGGMTGDVVGAAIETALTAALVTAAVLVGRVG